MSDYKFVPVVLNCQFNLTDDRMLHVWSKKKGGYEKISWSEFKVINDGFVDLEDIEFNLTHFGRHVGISYSLDLVDKSFR